MKEIHQQNIAFLKELFNEKKFNWIDHGKNISIDYFNSGGGTHLYLIENGERKYLGRINFYEPKNEWGVKKTEYEVLKLIENINISPKIYYFSDNNSLKQDFTIVEYIEGEILSDVTDKNVVDLATDLRKLHATFQFDKAGDTLPPQDELPYSCDIYNEFADGEDKKIEKYSSLSGIDKIIEPYNRINKRLGDWFNGLEIFDDCTKFCLCHADLKKENILVTKNGVMLIDWECAGSDILETDIGRLFSGCRFSSEQQELFLKSYFGAMPTYIILQRILAVKKVLDFFLILDDYILQNRKTWNEDEMLKELLEYENNIS